MKISIWQKDMDVIGSFAQELGAPTPLFSATLPIYAAAMATGYAEQDTAATCAVLEAMAGVKRGKLKAKRAKEIVGVERRRSVSKALREQAGFASHFRRHGWLIARRAANRYPGGCAVWTVGERERIAMVRRRISEQPTSRLAIWARRIALFSLAATVIAIIIVRSGALEIVPALSTLAGALVLAVVAILLAFGAGIVIWSEGVGGMREAVTALLLGLALIAYPLYARRQGLPAAGDLRRHHRPDRSAAVRGDRAVAAARRQSGHLCRPLCRRAAARRLFRHRARS